MPTQQPNLMGHCSLLCHTQRSQKLSSLCLCQPSLLHLHLMVGPQACTCAACNSEYICLSSVRKQAKGNRKASAIQPCLDWAAVHSFLYEYTPKLCALISDGSFSTCKTSRAHHSYSRALRHDSITCKDSLGLQADTSGRTEAVHMHMGSSRVSVWE